MWQIIFLTIEEMFANNWYTWLVNVDRCELPSCTGVDRCYDRTLPPQSRIQQCCCYRGSQWAHNGRVTYSWLWQLWIYPLSLTSSYWPLVQSRKILYKSCAQWNSCLEFPCQDINHSKGLLTWISRQQWLRLRQQSPSQKCGTLSCRLYQYSIKFPSNWI